MNATAIKLVIKLWHDDMPESPNDYDGWKAYSFSKRHGTFKDPYDIGFEEDEEGNDTPSADLRAKLDAGLAFFLSYYEHGNCLWSLAGEGISCVFDSVRFAGLLVWEQDEGDIGAVTYEDRKKDARAFIERFTNWCNGEVYGYTIEAFSKCPTCGQDEEAEADFDLPSCGGYYGDDIEGMVSDMKDHIGDDWKDYEVKFKDNMGGYLADECKRLWSKGE